MFEEKCREEYGRYFCRRCADSRIAAAADERYSMGAYAGMYCDPCWAKDSRNHDRHHDFMDAGEHFSELDY